MNLSPELEAQIIAGAIEALTAQLMAKIESHFEDLICLPFCRVAAILNLSETTARGICKEQVDFGPRDKRVTLSALKRVIEARTIKAKRRAA